MSAPRAGIVRWFRPLLLVPAVAILIAGEVPPPPPGVAPTVRPAGPPEVSPPSKIPDEEKWNFEPPVGERYDIFIDREAKLELEKRNAPKGDAGGLLDGPRPETNPAERRREAMDLSRQYAQRVEGLIVARKWDEAIKVCDNATKMLKPLREGDEEVGKDIERFERFRAQAVEAKIYEEAQTAFDALNLRIEGILWSPSGSLAVISDEPRARGINERVKDCVILNIDTNRVDFLYHYNRRRFEFQRFVGDAAPGKAR